MGFARWVVVATCCVALVGCTSADKYQLVDHGREAYLLDRSSGKVQLVRADGLYPIPEAPAVREINTGWRDWPEQRWEPGSPPLKAVSQVRTLWKLGKLYCAIRLMRTDTGTWEKQLPDEMYVLFCDKDGLPLKKVICPLDGSNMMRLGYLASSNKFFVRTPTTETSFASIECTLSEHNDMTAVRAMPGYKKDIFDKVIRQLFEELPTR